MDKPRRERKDRNDQGSEFEERVVEISRVSRVVKGGRRIRFRVLIVIGDKKGKIGYGIAKGNEIAVAVKKAVSFAKKKMIIVPVVNDTIPYEVNQTLGSARVFLKPAAQGTSVVAGGVVRVIAELSGIKNLLSKTIGTSNKVNNVKTVFLALSSFDPAKVEIVKKRYADKKVETTLIVDTELDTEKQPIVEVAPQSKVDGSMTQVADIAEAGAEVIPAEAKAEKTEKSKKIVKSKAVKK
ncbi:MAG: 30S ribosomal protein S5 [Candidatus Berkelbacteria bacterium]|nr:30S ribosomal protein S5 [Candidatus Berkelbacteria bacterium]